MTPDAQTPLEKGRKNFHSSNNPHTIIQNKKIDTTIDRLNAGS
jgi:hypothetical protein